MPEKIEIFTFVFLQVGTVEIAVLVIVKSSYERFRCHSWRKQGWAINEGFTKGFLIPCSLFSNKALYPPGEIFVVVIFHSCKCVFAPMYC